MLNISGLKEGIVLDHIKARQSMLIYEKLGLEKLDTEVAIIKNVTSRKMGKKDIIKIEGALDKVDLKALGFIDHSITVNIIVNEKIVEKRALQLPDEITDIIRCKNPRCITTTESKKKKKLNKTNRQKMSQMEFGTLKDYIQYKAKERGISIQLVNESYTSQTCPHCGKRHKPTNRNFECSCGYYAHRDLVGAWNILNKKNSFELTEFKVKTKQPLKLKPKKYRPLEVVVA